MLMAISSLNKIDFIDGNIQPPRSTNLNYNVWFCCNLMVFSWICVSTTPKIAQVILYIKTTKKMWNLLKHKFQQSNEARTFEIQQSLNNITHDQSSMSDYFTCLESIWNEQHQFSPISVCTYGKCAICTCKVLEFIAAREEKNLTMLFLMGLNENCLTIRGNILFMKPFSSQIKSIP